VLEGCYRGLRLDALSLDDRYLFLACLIPRLEGHDGLRVARLANWLVRSGMTDADRVTGWADELAPASEVSGGLILARAPLVSDLRTEWRTVVREAREGGRKPRESDFPSTT
jgi:hypothetical protein